MAHSHPHDHAHAHSHPHLPASGSLKVAFLLNITFTFIETAGGLWTGSIAILSDALHDAGDSLSLGLAWYLQILAARRPDAKFSYGYRRFSSLGALITGIVLIIGLSFVVTQALIRLRDPVAVKTAGMMLLALIGIAFNGFAAWRLRGGQSLNEKVASWHLLEDTLGWVAVLIGSAIMTVWDLPVIDPILSLLIALFILWNVGRNLRKVGQVFLQAAPPGFDLTAFEREVHALPQVLTSHHTHTWTLDGESHVFSMHLVLKQGSTRDQIVATKQHIYHLLQHQNFVHITIEAELEGEPCAGAAPGTSC